MGIINLGNLSELEKNKNFRAEFLYFILIGNSFINALFWDCFYYGTSKSYKKRRAQLYDHARNILDIKRPAEAKLLSLIIPEEKLKIGLHETIDCFSLPFSEKIIGQLPPNLIGAMEKDLRSNHAIFMRIIDDLGRKENITIQKALNALRIKRNLLLHYDEKNIKKQSVENDEIVIHALGMFLLPKLMHAFVGRVRHYETKQLSDKILSANLLEIHHEIQMTQKANYQRVSALENSKDNLKDKSRRKKRIDTSIPWRAYHLQHKIRDGNKTDYRENNFRIHYHFIGRKNIDLIEKYLNLESAENFHFKRDIENFYLLSHEVNKWLHVAFMAMKRDNNDKIIGRNDDETKLLKAIRNEISHNGFFWNCKDENGNLIAVSVVFSYVLSAHCFFTNRNETQMIIDNLNAIFKGEKYKILDSLIPQPTTLHIREWSPKNLDKLSKKHDAPIKRRRNFGKFVGKWIKALNKSVIDLNKKSS